MSSVDQHRELHSTRPTHLAQRVKGGPDGPTREEHIVDQDDDGVVDASGRKLGTPQVTSRAQTKVVTEHRDVERTGRNRGAFNVADASGQTVSKGNTPRGDPEKDERFSALVAFEHLVGDTSQRTLHVIGVENLAVTCAELRSSHADLLPRLSGRT